MNYRQMAKFLPLFTIIALFGNWMNWIRNCRESYTLMQSFQEGFLAAIPGILLLLLIVVLGVIIAHFIPWKGLPTVAYIVTLGCIMTIPGFPGAEFITAAVKKVNFMVLCTPILAYAGLAIGKDTELLKKQGWKIILVGLFVFVGTFIGSAVIAELVLRATGRI